VSLTACDATVAPATPQVGCTFFPLVAQQALSPELFVPFVKALKTAGPTLRIALAALIPKVNNVAEHGELPPLLATQDSQLRTIAVQLLTQLGGKTVNQALKNLRKDNAFTARADAIEILVRISGH